MGLFDSIAGNLLGGMLGGNQGGSNPLGSLLGGLMGGAVDHQGAASTIGDVINSSGGISGLLQKAQSMGLGNVVSSWIGTGANQSISGDEVTQLLGGDAVRAAAAKFGLNVEQAKPLIASMLPVIIDKLTPRGEATDAEHSGDALQSALSGLLSNGGLQNILTSVLSGGARPA